ncbi:Uncharacterized MFS-type transporter YcnB [Carnobacterium divergens]|nr:Uncharacterized MFS-type transporter YcnB [Carnobacterium divergens]
MMIGGIDVEHEHQKSHIVTILGVIIMGTFVTILNQTLMSTALPSIMKEFSITAVGGQWLTTSYMLINGIMIPITAYLVERFTTRQLYLFAMICFTIGTLIAATSSVYWVLIGGRMIQAIGAGIVLPLQTIVVLYMFPIEKRGSAMGLIGLAMNFAPAIGPTFSGWVVQNYSWNMLFYFILPFAILDVVVAYFVLKNVSEVGKPRLDWLSVVYSTLGFGGLLFGFSNAASHDFFSINVGGVLLVGIASILLLIKRCNASEHPLLNFKVFKFRGFRLNVMISFIILAGMYGGIILFPIYFQSIRGFDPMKSGMILLPGSIVIAVMSPITGRLFDRYGGKILAVTGLFLITVTTFMIGRLTLTSSISTIIGIQLVRSLGIALTLMPLQTGAFNAVPLSMAGHASAMFNTQRQLAGSMGTALFVVIMMMVSNSAAALNQGSPQLASLSGFQAVFFVVGIFSLIGLILSIFVRDEVPKSKVKIVQENTK